MAFKSIVKKLIIYSQLSITAIIISISFNSYALTTTYSDHSSWLTDLLGGADFFVDFNEFTEDTSITSPLDVGPFSIESSRGRFVDVPPYLNSDTVYGDGTPNLNIFVEGTSDVAIMTFDSPIYAWFGDFWSAGNISSPLDMTLVSTEGNTNLTVGTRILSFGFISDKPITEIILHNDINDGFHLDNIAGKYVVPIPSAVWLFGSGLLGLVSLARRKANA